MDGFIGRRKTKLFFGEGGDVQALRRFAFAASTA